MNFLIFLLAIVLGILIIRKISKRTLNRLLISGVLLITGVVIYFTFWNQSNGTSSAMDRLDSLESVAGTNGPVLDIESTNINLSSDRVAMVKKRIKTASPILDAEFDIYDVNAGNSRSIPGASDRDYRVIMKIRSEYLLRWSKGMERVPDYDYSWMKSTPRFEKWKIQSRPKIYKRPNEESYVLIFNRENIVAKRFEVH